LATQTILSLGASHLTLAVLSESEEGPVLEQVVHQALSGKGDQKEQWLRLVDVGLGQVSEKFSLKAISGLVLPGWAVLSKLLEVTRIEGAGQDEVVRFEAQNAMPNGLDGYDWTYQVLEDDSFERDVLVQAVATNFLKSLLDVLKPYGAEPRWVDALISAQLSAFQNQYGLESGTSVVLDVGSRSVSLLVLSRQDLPFIRNFNFGGDLITQAIASQLGKSHAEAERLKLEWITDKGDVTRKEILNKASEGFVTRLVNEVQRSLALYRRQGQPGNPARLLLTGGASQLPGLADFLERKTGVPVAFYDAFRGVSTGPGLSTTQASRFNFVLPAPMGLGMRLFDSGQDGPNLLPRQLTSHRALSEKKPWWMAAAALLLISGILIGLKFHFQAWDLQRKIATLDSELAPLESLSQQVQTAHEAYTRLVSETEAKQKLLGEKQYWVAFLADLQQRLNRVQDVWLESTGRIRSPR
jgi:type IV pilus assembly protein PilM